MLNLPVASEGLCSRGLLGMGEAHHIYWRVVLQLGLVVILCVVSLTLHLSNRHVVHQQGVVLNITAANMVAPGLLVCQLVLVLFRIQSDT